MTSIGFFYPTSEMAQVAFHEFQVAQPWRKERKNLRITLQAVSIQFFALDQAHSHERVAGLSFSAMVVHPSVRDDVRSYLKAYLREAP